MRSVRCLLSLIVLVGLSAATYAADASKPKRLLLVTHSGGFMHDSILVAEQVLKEIGPKNGFEVTCWRFTGDPDAKVQVGDATTALQKYSNDFRTRTGEKGKPGEEVTKAQCGRINRDTLPGFDAVLFFTTGKPVTLAEEKDLIEWVKAGHAFAATHCGADTLYTSTYGELLGGLFQTHPRQQNVRLKVEDSNHPAARGFTDGMEYFDEWYIFKEQPISGELPYSRANVHVILSMYPDSFKPNYVRKDNDYAISWCREFGKGKVFYTSMGHRGETWRDPRFQASLLGGLDWAVGRVKGDATPSSKLPDRKSVV